MSVLSDRNLWNSPDFDKDTSTASNLSLARPKTAPRRIANLIRRAYPALLKYAMLAVALAAIVALRLQLWLPLYWH